MKRVPLTLLLLTLGACVGAGILVGLRDRKASAAPLVSAAQTAAPAKVAHRRKRAPRKVREVAQTPEVCPCACETDADTLARIYAQTQADDPSAHVESVTVTRTIETASGARVNEQVTLTPERITAPVSTHGGPLARRGD